MKIDILVVSYHAKNELAQTLSSIALYSAPGYRLTVHDNTAVNYPLTWLWNRFVERSRRELIALVNSDVIVGPGWDSEAIACLSEDPSVGSVGPISNYPQHSGFGTIQPPNSESIRAVVGETEVRRSIMPRFVKGRENSLVGGHCMLFRKSAWEKAGSMDERFPFASNDWNFNQRLIDCGYSLGVCLRAVCLHWWNASIKDGRSKGLMGDRPVFETPGPGLSFETI